MRDVKGKLVNLEVVDTKGLVFIYGWFVSKASEILNFYDYLEAIQGLNYC